MDILTLAMAKAYTDSQRLASSEVVTTKVFPEQNISHTFDDELFIITDMMAGFRPVVGREYIVTINGVEYKTVTTYTYNETQPNNVYIGNNPNDLDTPYEIFPWSAFWEDGEVYFMWSAFAYQDTTLSIRQETETIHPIDPKYLPGVCLPVVELSAKLPEYNYVVLTESESSKITEMAQVEMPFILKVGHRRDESIRYAVVMNYTTWYTVLDGNNSSPYGMFTGTINGYTSYSTAPGVQLEYDSSSGLWRLWSQFSV